MYKSALTMLHISGIVFGLGAATVVELLLAKSLATGMVTEKLWWTVSRLSRVVAIALALLCVSGFGFLHNYMVVDPEQLANPKLVAKLTLVFLLALNGLFIHRFALPLMGSRVGLPLLEGLSARQRNLLLASGSVSATTWYALLTVGTVSQLNFGPSASTILFAYLLVLAIVIAAAQWLVSWAERQNLGGRSRAFDDASHSRIARFVTARSALIRSAQLDGAPSPSLIKA